MHEDVCILQFTPKEDMSGLLKDRYLEAYVASKQPPGSFQMATSIQMNQKPVSRLCPGHGLHCVLTLGKRIKLLTFTAHAFTYHTSIKILMNS